MSADIKIARILARKSDLNPSGGPQAAWTAIAHANRIFGPHGWSREVLEMRNAANREREGMHTSAYVARVRLTVQMPDGPVVRDSHGCGEGKGRTPFEAHDHGLKAAELDATLRALVSFGNAFGLATLSGAGSVKAPRKRSAAPRQSSEGPGSSDGPAPGHAASGGEQQRAPGEPEEETEGADGGPAGDPAPISATLAQYDDSAMLAPKLRRIRSPAHLSFVRAQPCLICGRAPSDAHHLRFVSQGPWQGRSLTSSQCRYAGATTICFTATQTNRAGGRRSGSILWWPLPSSGRKAGR